MSLPILGPTYSEMRQPWTISPAIREKAKKASQDDPINLFNITWRHFDDTIRFFVLPKAFTGIDANIIVLYAKDFPSGSHKVGPTYAVLMEQLVTGEVNPSQHTMVWPSTGNYGVGGAWVSARMKCRSIVILPEEMSKERFDLIRGYGSEVIATKGCESNVKEIYDKTHELKMANPDTIRILNQFESFGNYRFHYHVTGNTMVDLVKEQKIGNARLAAVVSAVGSAGTIASGDCVKKHFPEAKTVAVEPIQCPTLSLNGYGAHDIQGIGDKHVTWIHNVMNTDAVIQVDDMESKTLLKIITSTEGQAYLRTFLDADFVAFMSDKLGISGCANILAAIKTAKYYGFKSGDNIVTVATDGFDRYPSVMAKMPQMIKDEVKGHFERIVTHQMPSYVFEGDRYNRLRWHNLKYYTWVEQQGKEVSELDAMLDQGFWQKEADKALEMDQKILEWRRDHHV